MDETNMPLKPKAAAAKIAAIYLALGVLWILLSDRVLFAIVKDADRLTSIQSYKGWIFVLASGTALYLLIAHLLRSVRAAQEEVQASEARFRSLAEASPDGILVEQGEHIVYANTAAAALLGTQDSAALLGARSLDFVDPEHHDAVLRHRAMSPVEKHENPLLELCIRRRDGRRIDIQAACGDVEWHGGHASQMVLRDVTDLKRMQAKLRRMSERLQLAVEGSGECIWDLDLESNVVSLSGNLRSVMDMTSGKLESSPRDWMESIHPDDLARVNSSFEAAVRDDSGSYECEYRVKAIDGSWKWVWARGVVVERDDKGKPLAMAGTLADITMRKNSDELAWRYANLDALTGLPNRRLFHDRLHFELLQAKRSGAPLALLFIDLDGFKRINDLYGHEAGDLLLLEAGHRISSCVRETDIVARLGGDEFTVTLSRLVEVEHVEPVCQKILACLAAPFHIGNDVGYVSCSIGISLFPMDAVTPEDLLRKADQAMYAAKRGGKNQFHYFTREMDEKARHRLRIAQELRRALEDKQLSVVYQPVIDMRNGRIAKAEALVRWHHPSFGDIGPATFIPMAEESGLIREIGNWVFAQAAMFSKSCSERAGTPFQISINKSPVQFIAREGEDGWLSFLEQEGIEGRCITVEITEGVLLDASDTVERKLLAYRDAGIQLALDDFGTGYASMSYLQKFRVDYVKIDQSFVRNMTSDPSSRTIAETIILMAHRLGQKVIAEGVETQEQFECLAAAGCDFGQGYLFSRPVPPERLQSMLAENARARQWLQ